MRELLELRVYEEFAGLAFAPREGERLSSGLVRKVVLPTGSAQWEDIAAVARKLRSEGRFLFAGWEYRRAYSAAELAAAPILHLRMTATFEPAGEECGTQYDETTACAICRAGRTQRSPLRLNLKRLPRKDMMRTIAGEWVVSRRLAEALTGAGLAGFELLPVRQRGHCAEEAVEVGAPAGTRTLPPAAYYQLVVTAPRVRLVAPTIFGIDPFDHDTEQQYVCPLGDTAGLNVLSELWVDTASPLATDIAVTQQYAGVRRGLLVPEPLLLISQRFYQVLRDAGAKGYAVEVTHLAKAQSPAQ